MVYNLADSSYPSSDKLIKIWTSQKTVGSYKSDMTTSEMSN